MLEARLSTGLFFGGIATSRTDSCVPLGFACDPMMRACIRSRMRLIETYFFCCRYFPQIWASTFSDPNSALVAAQACAVLS